MVGGREVAIRVLNSAWLSRIRESRNLKLPVEEMQLDLTLELLHMDGNTYLDEDPAEPWPPNVIRFRVRRAR